MTFESLRLSGSKFQDLLSNDNWMPICSTSECWWTEGTITAAQHCCGVFLILVPDTKLQTYLFSYLLIYLLTYC